MSSFSEHEGLNPIEATQQRFIRDIRDADWQRLEDMSSEKISLANRSPLFIRLGQRGLEATPHDTLAVVNPSLHLPELARIGLNDRIPAFLIQPTIFNPINGVGFKALRANESLTIGRSTANMDFTPRFGKFSGDVSRDHVKLVMDNAGLSFTLQDLQSGNGTFLFEKKSEWPPISSADTIAAETHPGANQDAYVNNDEDQLYGVFDGMGSTQGAAMAAKIAAGIFKQQGSELPDTGSPAEMGPLVRRILEQANTTILNQQRGTDMGTTAVIAKIHTSRDGTSRIATIASAGDSRAYLFRNGTLTAITTDHSAYRALHGKEAAKAHQEKFAAANTDVIKKLSEKDQVDFKFRYLISSNLGNKGIQIDIEHVAILPGDVLLFTTDGVHDNLTTQEIHATLGRASSGSHYAKDLVRFAHERSHQKDYDKRAKVDDITAVAVEL